MKINIGSGYTKPEGFINIDDDILVNPDYLVNLDDVNIKLPFEDNSVEYILATHILEHIGEGFIPLLVELYRVGKHGAILDIVVPHHLHEVYYGDPTHKRPITVNCMSLFDKAVNLEDIDGHSSALGLKYNVNYQMVWYDYDYDPFYQQMITDFRIRQEADEVSQEENWAFTRLMREANNVAINTKMKLVIIKE